MTIGQNIKQARNYMGLTQRELAEKLGVTQSMITAYETGARNPKNSTLSKIATALNLSLDFTSDGEPHFFIPITPDMIDTPHGHEAIIFNEVQCENAQNDCLIPGSNRTQKAIQTAFQKLDDLRPRIKNLPKTDEEYNQIIERLAWNEVTENFHKLNRDGKVEASKKVEELTMLEKYTKKDED